MNTDGLIQIGQLRTVDESAYTGRGASKGLHRVHQPGHGVVLFKEFLPEVAATVRRADLQHLVTWRCALGSETARHLDTMTAFPLAVVVDGDQTLGVTMREAEDRFLYTNRRGQQRPRTLASLSTTQAFAAQADQFYYQPPHKLALLGRLLTDLEFLHDRGLVVGDLQPENVLVTADPRQPGLLFLDCDSMWLDGQHAFPEVVDPESYHCPWARGAFRPDTDLYKFSLIAIRCIAEDNALTAVPHETLARFMPRRHAELLEALREETHGRTIQSLSSLTRNWRSRVGQHGEMYLSTDQFAMQPWIPTSASGLALRRPSAPAKCNPPTMRAKRGASVHVPDTRQSSSVPARLAPPPVYASATQTPPPAAQEHSSKAPAIAAIAVIMAIAALGVLLALSRLT